MRITLTRDPLDPTTITVLASPARGEPVNFIREYPVATTWAQLIHDINNATNTLPILNHDYHWISDGIPYPMGVRTWE